MQHEERKILLAQAGLSRERGNSVDGPAELFWLVKNLTECIMANVPISIIPFLSLPSL